MMCQPTFKIDLFSPAFCLALLEMYRPCSSFFAFGLPVGDYWARIRFSLLAGVLASAVTAPIASERWIDRLAALLPIAWMAGIGGWMLLP